MIENADASPGRPAPGVPAWLFALTVLAVSLLALTNRSFWIDETYTARLAQQATLRGCWHLLREIKGSDPQMPLYVFWMWLWEKLAGSGELALRAANLCWFVPALFVLRRMLAANRPLQLAVFLAAAISPFAWYYLNEARAYTLQFSASLVLFAIVCYWAQNREARATGERGRVALFAVALFVLCGSSLLSMVLAAAPLLLAAVVLPGKRLLELGKTFWRVWAVTLAALFSLGLYYLWTLLSGDRASDIATTNWKNVVFIGYELFGFDGLGPGRLEIRNGGNEVFRPYLVPLGAYALILAVLMGLALWSLWQRFGTRKLCGMFLAVGLPAGLVIAASAVSHFRVLGRHLAALLPVVIILLGLGLATAWRRGSWGRLLSGVFLLLSLLSALSLRFAARHEKDNYRAAAALAKTALAAGQTVWWNADPNAAIYYQLPVTTTGQAASGVALWVRNPSPETLSAAVPPDVIVASRKDVYDANGLLAKFMAQQRYHVVTSLMMFEVWRRSGSGNPRSEF